MTRKPPPQNTTDPISKRTVSATQEPKLTVETKEEERLREIVRALVSKIKAADEIIAKFKLDIDQNVYALEWSLSTFEASARRTVFHQILKALTDADGKPQLYRPNEQEAITGMLQMSTLQRASEYVNDEVMRRARQGSRSTSATSNLVHEQLLVAWADAAELIKFA